VRELEQDGQHQCTHQWMTKNLGLSRIWDALADLKGVEDCDVFIAYVTDAEYAYRGTSTELGMALALRKRIFLVTSLEPLVGFRSNVFAHMPGICVLKEWSELLFHMGVIDKNGGRPAKRHAVPQTPLTPFAWHPMPPAAAQQLQHPMAAEHTKPTVEEMMRMTMDDAERQEAFAVATRYLMDELKARATAVQSTVPAAKTKKRRAAETTAELPDTAIGAAPPGCTAEDVEAARRHVDRIRADHPDYKSLVIGEREGSILLDRVDGRNENP